jgi:hypothetical protein
MNRTTSRFLFACTLAIVCGASSAHGAIVKSGNCPWKNLPERTRTAALQAGLVGGPAALMSQIPKGQIALAERVCGFTDSNQAVYHRAEAGYMLQMLAEAWLARFADISPARLDVAWTRTGTATKRIARKWAIYLILGPNEADALYADFSKTLSANMQTRSADIRPQIMTYIQARALQGTYDPEL